MKRILLFSCVEWFGLKQRPHFMAEGLAEMGYKLVYLKVGADRTVCRDISDNLRVHELSFIRGYMRLGLIRKAARAIISNCLKDVEFDAVIITDPVQLDMLPEKLQKKPIIYDCMDMMPEFYLGRKKALSRNMEQKLCKKADRITVSSLPLLEYIKSEYGVSESKITLIHNAFDEKETAFARSNKELIHPALIYIGAIEKWMDIDLLYDFMRENDEFHLYIVGKGAELDKLRDIKSCTVLGAKDHMEALNYLKSADIALIPFKNSPLIDAVDPIKIYEYLALKKPVVSARWKALRRFENAPGVFFYDDDISFAKAIERAISNLERISEYDNSVFCSDNNWLVRVKDMNHVIEEATESRH